MSNLLADIARRRQLEAIRGKAQKATSRAHSAAEAHAAGATGGPSLNDVLTMKGMFTSPAAPGRKNVHDVAGRIVLENVTAGEVWDYLRGVRQGVRALPPGLAAKRKKAKKRKAKKRAKAAKPASTPSPKKKAKKKRRAKKAKKKAGKKKRAKAPKHKKAKKKKAKKK